MKILRTSDNNFLKKLDFILGRRSQTNIKTTDQTVKKIIDNIIQKKVSMWNNLVYQLTIKYFKYDNIL